MLKWKANTKIYYKTNIANSNLKIMDGSDSSGIDTLKKGNIITDSKRSSLKVTYEKTSCYFCNEWLDTQTFKEHIIHCGQVLEKCPQSCEVYVQRKRMRNHLRECPKVIKRNSSTNISTNENQNETTEFINRISVLEQDINALRSVLNEEIKQRLHLITDVGSLRKHNQISDEWTQKVGDVLFNMKRCINEEASFRTSEINRLNDEISKLLHENHDLKRYNMNLSRRLDEVQNILSDEENFRQNFLSLTEDGRNNAIENQTSLKNEIDAILNKISMMSFHNENNHMLITENITSIENQISQQEATFWSKIQKVEEILNEIQANLQTKFISNTELNTKQINLDYEVKSMKNIVCETEEKCEKLEKIVYNVEKAIQRTHQGLLDLEGHLLYQKKMVAIQNTRGHLIWRLSEYTQRFEEARKFDGSIQGPLFTNKPFGYTLRLDVFLNGIGNWKGRNIIACLNVIPGEFDTLLSWPCKLQADIILKDQTYNEDSSQDYIRQTIVKRKNDDFHSNQYIHIPHKIVESRNYIKNDSIVFEIRVQKIK
ncbi:TNF receptor-associated factor 5 [Condylostylus longicornis]|uniref:TNF receptor-associated factor 5 n=1 Tax=Condylostylus longicornis TaxID=2530218 RepID=UPI00244DDB33|nr:TNF receptor-associated factor 5 [Condylostylus longicornis]